MALPIWVDGRVVAALTGIGAPGDFSGKKEQNVFGILKKFADPCEEAVAKA